MVFVRYYACVIQLPYIKCSSVIKGSRAERLCTEVHFFRFQFTVAYYYKFCPRIYIYVAHCNIRINRQSAAAHHNVVCGGDCPRIRQCCIACVDIRHTVKTLTDICSCFCSPLHMQPYIRTCRRSTNLHIISAVRITCP